MGESEVRALALFFFYVSLDENRAREAAAKAADEFERLRRRDSQLEAPMAVVLASHKIWHQLRTRLIRGRPAYSAESGWLFPEGVDLSHWKEFQKSAPEDELLAVVWVHVLGIHESQVSRALGLTEGTLRYRVGRGLRKLGSFLAPAHRPLKPVGPS